MSISIKDARKRLGKAGIALGQGYRTQNESGSKTTFQVTTPIGTELQLDSGEVVGLLQDLQRFDMRG
jgi:hypothetical protein